MLNCLLRVRVPLSLLVSLLIAGSCRAQVSDDGKRPLKWAADMDGGIPYIFKDPDGNLTGFEVDLKDALEQEFGRKIEFVQYEFESLIQGVLRKDFDFAMNGLEITGERQKVVRFSRPYFLYQLQLVVRRDESRIRTLEDCKQLKATVGTLAGSQAENVLKQNEITTVAFKGQDEIYQKLSKGNDFQAVLLDVPVNMYYAAPDASLPYSQAQKYPGLKFAGPPFAEGYYGIAVHADNEKLARALDDAIDRLQKNGTLKKILQKWELWNGDQYRLYTDTSPAAQAKEMPFSVYFPMLLDGAWLTVQLTVLSFCLAVALGLPIAVSRLYGPAPLRLLATIYVEFFRGIPVLMLLFFLYFGLPGLVPGLRLGAFEAAIIGLGMNYAAYESEIYRAGISSIPLGQWEAAASLGMSPSLTFRRIILPQSFRVILPPMTNDLVALFKDTSVVSIIALVELSKQYQILTRSGAGYVGIALTTAALYLIMSVPLGHLSRYLEKRWSKG